MGTGAETAPNTLSLGGDAALGQSYLLVVEDDTSTVVPLPDIGSVLIGRAGEAEVRLRDPACSRSHARLHVGGGRVVVEDLGSHNGTRVGSRPVAGRLEIASGDVVAIGKAAIVVGFAAHSRPVALIDAAAFRDRCAQEIDRAVRYERAVSIVAVRCGGAPAALEGLLRGALRRLDVAARPDDGELWVLMSELDGAAAKVAAGALLGALARGQIAADSGARAGVATCPGDGCDADTLIGAARAAAAAAPGGAIQSTGEADQPLAIGERTALVADPAMVHLYRLLRRLADSELPVLIVGETGVGKENAAYALHAWSRRAGSSFLAINCAALPGELVESELFGHEKGAFSGSAAAKAGLLESASGGTVLLDEIGDLPLPAQAKLLRALEQKAILRVGGLKEHAVDVRFVAATNRDLTGDVEAGRFRRDLFYRVGGAVVRLPPLRDRPREIALLARRFLDEARAARGAPPAVLSAAAMDALFRHRWPGNVRELKNEMGYVAATAEGNVVEPWHLSERVAGGGEPDDAGAAPPRAAAAEPGTAGARRPLTDELRELERRRMVEALRATGGVQKQAAALLSMPVRTFRMKAKQYGIDRADS